MLSRTGAVVLVLCAMQMQADDSKKPSPIHYRSITSPVVSTAPVVERSGNEQIASAPGRAEEEGMACYGADTPKLIASTSRYPVGSHVRVTNLATGKSVVVTITEHAEIQGRIINVSRMAADQLGFVRAGTTRVRLARVKEQANAD